MVCDVLKAAVATPSSAQQELLHQQDERDFILRHFVEPVCQKFRPTSSDESVYCLPLSARMFCFSVKIELGSVFLHFFTANDNNNNNNSICIAS